MNWLDITILVIIGLSTAMAVWKGFIKEVVSMVAFYLAVILSGRLYPIVQPLFTKMVGNGLDSALAFLFVFFGILALGGLAVWLMNKVLAQYKLKSMDRVLGGLLGVMRGWLICIVVILGLAASPIEIQALKNSKMSRYVLACRGFVLWVLPGDMKAGIEKKAAEMYQNDVNATPLPPK